ncbi:MAG: hypothetical protein J7K26_01965 [Candidatus Aenigmarchaeota archaeon]|nr:hypothetical protein [Candidatus Aenigmarchaeota archaeon]
MTQVDFIISIGLIITIISIVLFYSISQFETNFNQSKINEIKAKTNSLAKELFETDILTEHVSTLKVKFVETGGLAYNENIKININGDGRKAYANYFNMNKISSDFSNNILNLDLHFDPYETKYITIYYFGNISDASYIQTNENISAKIIMSRNISILVQDKCSYDYLSKLFGTKFKIESKICNVGNSPPETTVVSINYPMLIESNGIEVENVKVLSW